MFPSTEPDLDLTQRLRAIVETRAENRGSDCEPFLELYDLYNVPVYRAELLPSNCNPTWGHNAYLFTTLGLAEVLRAWGFQKWKPIHTEDEFIGNSKMSKLWTRELMIAQDINYTAGVTITQEDITRLELQSAFRIFDIDGADCKGAMVEDLEKLTGIQLNTEMVQPGGLQPLRSEIFNRLIFEVQRTQGALFVVNAFLDKDYYCERKGQFCVAYLSK